MNFAKATTHQMQARPQHPSQAWLSLLTPGCSIHTRVEPMQVRWAFSGGRILFSAELFGFSTDC